MDKNEKEKRASRVSMMLLDELEGDEGAKVTLPLVFAVLIASILQFNGEFVCSFVYLFLCS